MSTGELTVIIPCAGRDCDEIEPFPDLRTLIVRNKRYGEAIRHGILHTTTPYLATMDADGQHTLRDVLKLWRVVQAQDLDMAIGQRPHRGVGPRPMASRLLNLTASIIAGRHVPDLGCGARVFRRDMALELYPRLPDGFDFNAVLTTLALVRGYDVCWVRIPDRPRRQGRSHVRWADGPRTLRSLVRVARNA